MTKTTGKGSFGGKRNTNGFKNNPQNINRAGRKPKIYTKIKKMGYSPDDVKTVFKELVFYKLDDLQKVYEDAKKPIIVRIVANQFYQALKKNDYQRIKEIMEHVIGKAPQTVENNVKLETQIDYSKLSDAALEELYKASK